MGRLGVKDEISLKESIQYRQYYYYCRYPITSEKYSKNRVNLQSR